MTGKRRVRGEGTVYKDETRNRWVGQVWLDGRRRKVTGRTQEEAAKKLGNLVHGDESERHADKRATVASVLEEWQAKALAGKNLAPSTRTAHAWGAEILTREIGRVKLANLDAPTVEAALAHIAKDGRSKASLIKIRSTLRQALRWAMRRRMVAYNAADAAELPVKVKEAKVTRALEPEELRRLLDALADHPLLPAYALMARVGLRPGEASGVCWDALDLEGDPPTVAVIRAVQLKRGRPYLVDDLKTAGARRTIALPSDLVEILSRSSPGGEQHLDRARAHDHLVVAAPDGGPVWPSTMRSELVKACETAKVKPPITPNELRHTAATIMANAGLPPHHVADILGHRSTRMVDQVYRHRPAVIRGADTVNP